MDTQDLQGVIRQVSPFLTSYGLKILGAIAILVVGRFFAGLMGRVVQGSLRRGKIDESLIGFVETLVRRGIFIIAVIAALSKLGVQTTSLVAVIGAAGLAVGLALQGSLSNFAAGILILLFRPYRVGDMIESSGARGKVKEIGILATTLATPDNQKVILPNGPIMAGKIINVNAFPTRRIDLVASISYEDDIEKAREVLHRIVDVHPLVLKEPEAVVEVLEMADSSVNLVVRPWVNTPDYWSVFFDLNRSIKLELERSGLTIPFPQRDVHLLHGPTTAA